MCRYFISSASSRRCSAAHHIVPHPGAAGPGQTLLAVSEYSVTDVRRSVHQPGSFSHLRDGRNVAVGLQAEFGRSCPPQCCPHTIPGCLVDGPAFAISKQQTRFCQTPRLQLPPDRPAPRPGSIGDSWIRLTSIMVTTGQGSEVHTGIFGFIEEARDSRRNAMVDRRLTESRRVSFAGQLIAARRSKAILSKAFRRRRSVDDLAKGSRG